MLPSMVTFLWSEMSLHQQAQKLEATRKEMEGRKKEGEKKIKIPPLLSVQQFFLPLFFLGRELKDIDVTASCGGLV